MYYFSTTILLLITTGLFMLADLEAAMTGEVYRDFNNNHTFNGGDVGVSGITVRGIAEAGNTATATTITNGDYTLNIGGCAGRVHVTFDIQGYNYANIYPPRASLYLGAVFEDASKAHVWEFDSTTNSFTQALQPKNI